ncbi:hypothetical protein C8J57DRAFT_1221491 [Mycena rebaudengoi]|nr:hypothetical protein C8J57DRAFT_1221491 [Mycena rebaudengoi]
MQPVRNEIQVARSAIPRSDALTCEHLAAQGHGKRRRKKDGNESYQPCQYAWWQTKRVKRSDLLTSHVVQNRTCGSTLVASSHRTATTVNFQLPAKFTTGIQFCMAPTCKGRDKRRQAGVPSGSADVSAQSFTLSADAFMMGPEDELTPSFVECTSADLRRNYRDIVPLAPPSPVKRARMQGSYAVPVLETNGAAVVFNDMPSDLYQMPGLGEDDPPLASLPARINTNRFKLSDKVLNRFMHNLRDTFLKELVRRDGCVDASEEMCPRCKAAIPMHRCQECFGGEVLCAACCIDMHLENPLHVIYKWNGIFFEKSPLHDLGLRIQLGHAPRQLCDKPEPAPRDFVVLHDNGIHEVAVDFCSCKEMLRTGWFPTTDGKPKTCATLILLDKFLMQTLQAKTTMYDFYGALEKLSNNEGMCREYHHLLLLKRRGQAHDPRGVKQTAAGELAIRCPTCPRPGINLPEDWETATEENKFLYILFLALDACFRMKRGLVSSELKDPGLGTGWAYVTEGAPYRVYLLTKTNQVEMSTCSGLAALGHANTKFSCGYSSTGIGMGVCVRHEFIQPTGVGDLQKSERYANMDYIFGSLLRHHHPLLYKIISYDIVCQWWKELLERMQELPPLVRCALILHLIRFVIPKLHIHAHTLACHILYSLDLIPGSGQTDGEGIERPWANIGGIASSTFLLARADRFGCLIGTAYSIDSVRLIRRLSNLVSHYVLNTPNPRSAFKAANISHHVANITAYVA